MEALVNYGPFALFGGLIAWDFIAPARQFPQVRLWRLKGLVLFVLFNVIAVTVPLFTDEWLGRRRLIDATGLGTAGGALVGFLVLQLGVYAWHRLMHNVDFLWRWFHQMHHSAERVDVFGAFFFHPLDAVGFTVVGSLILVLLVGVNGEAAAFVNLAATFCTIFQHANIRTPRWLGYLIQRPENHAVHHERYVHAYNYGDIPLWDMVFGTFRNPAQWSGEAGFYDGASSRIGEMLIGRDVAEPKEIPADYPGGADAAA